MTRTWGRRLARIAGYAVFVLLVVASLAITFTVGWRTVIGARTRPLTARTFQPTAERMRRGEYLVHSVARCMGCHAKYDEKAEHQKGERPVPVSKDGAGAALFHDGPISVVAPNITSDPETGLGKWSDDAIARAIREGIADDGRVLLPVMPYENFRQMSDEDVASVVVFLRTLPPVRSTLAPTKVPFLLTRLFQSVPQPVTSPVPEPDRSTPTRQGSYLARMGSCSGCHTPRTPQFRLIPGMEMAGGALMIWGEAVATANVTPDPSGIVYYDDVLFIETMRTGYVRGRQLNSMMPWWVYGNMTDDDLKALFAYLRTLQPVHHEVDNTETPVPCKLCGNRHGLGNRN